MKLTPPPSNSLEIGICGENGYAKMTEIYYVVNSSLAKSFAVVESPPLPTAFVLYQNYPNPFNPETTISYDLPEQSPVLLIIYDLRGREVARLVEEMQSAGSYSVHWRPSNLSSGAYLCRLTADSETKIIKIMYIK